MERPGKVKVARLTACTVSSETLDNLGCCAEFVTEFPRMLSGYSTRGNMSGHVGGMVRA